MSFLEYHHPSAWRAIQKLQLLHIHLHELCQCTTTAITYPRSLGVVIKVLASLINFKCKLLLCICQSQGNLSQSAGMCCCPIVRWWKGMYVASSLQWQCTSCSKWRANNFWLLNTVHEFQRNVCIFGTSSTIFGALIYTFWTLLSSENVTP